MASDQPAAKATSLARLLALYQGPNKAGGDAFSPLVAVTYKGAAAAPVKVKAPQSRAELFIAAFTGSAFFDQARAGETITGASGMVVWTATVAQWYNDDLATGSYGSALVAAHAEEVLAITKRFKFAVATSACAQAAAAPQGIHNCAAP